MSNSDQSTPASPRHCGACIACCSHLELPDAAGPGSGKPPGAPCRHAGALGCRRHAQRPHVCAAFSCVWLSDPGWPAAWRPDRCGLLCIREESDGIERAVVHELRDGALTSALAAEILTALARSVATVAVSQRPARRLAS